MAEKVETEIACVIDQGIWEAVQHSPWVHGMVTVPKPNGTCRITTDLKPLNQYVEPFRFPLPLIDEIFLKLQKARIYSKLDLTKAYFHIELAPESLHLTTTITRKGLMQYRRMPMGLCDSGTYFQYAIEKTEGGIENVEVYGDEVIVHGTTVEEHDKALARALAAMSRSAFLLCLK